MKAWMAGIFLAAASTAKGIDVGEAAPDFAAQDEAGKNVKLSDYKGQWVVLYFYPKSFTPGCTKEACSLRDGYGDIQKLGAVVLGVSFDDVETQSKFRSKNSLPFQLLADTKKSVAKSYNAVGLGGVMAQRKTFIIDPDGKVAHVFPTVNIDKHVQEIKDVLTKLKANPSS
jgi:peroxiredoxin Q/BCP